MIQQILNNKKILLVLIVLVIGIPLTVFLALKQQETRSRADVSPVHFEISPQTDTKNLTQTFSVDVNIIVGGNSLSGIDANIAISKDIVDFVRFVPTSFDTVVTNEYSTSTGLLQLTLVNTTDTPLVGTVKVGTLTLTAKVPGTATVTVEPGAQVVALGQEAPLQIGTNLNGSYTVVAPSPSPTPTPTPSPSTSPSSIPTPKPVNYDGYFDVLNCNYMTGWAADRNNLNTPLTVDVYIDGNKFTNITADKPRPDIAPYLGSNNTNHGFTSPTFSTLKDGNAHTVRIQYGGTGLGLGTNNKTITCAP